MLGTVMLQGAMSRLQAYASSCSLTGFPVAGLTSIGPSSCDGEGEAPVCER